MSKLLHVYYRISPECIPDGMIYRLKEYHKNIRVDDHKSFNIEGFEFCIKEIKDDSVEIQLMNGVLHKDGVKNDSEEFEVIEVTGKTSWYTVSRDESVYSIAFRLK